MPAEPQVLRLSTLSGGVATQAAAKRLPSEVSVADNVFLTLEKSAEKRQPTFLVNSGGDFGALDIVDVRDDALYYYYDLDGTNRQLIVLNPSATLDSDIIQVFNAETGVREAAPSLTSSLINNPTFKDYLLVGEGDVPLDERIRFIGVKGSILILNTEVEAKFLTTGAGAAITYTDITTGDPVRAENKTVDLNGVLQDTGLNRENYSFFRLPPTDRDPILPNGAEDVVGPGLVWYARESYLNFPGQAFYKAVDSQQQPWYQLTRTEQAGSVLDGDTWPWLLDYDPDSDDFAVGQPKWAPRYTGTQGNNPGPTPISDTDRPYEAVNNTGAKLTAGVYFRNRLWFASGDTLFSSELNDPFNFYLKDPSTIVDTDVIDITAASGTNSTISWLVAYSDFLFVTATGDTQYELTGSQNFIGPRTATLEPTSFYGAAKFTEPTKVGSLLYFVDEGRLFVYYGSASENVQSAVNVSKNVYGYFPKKISSITSAGNQDTLLFVDDAHKDHIYAYTARFDGDKQMQNAFYRWTTGDSSQVRSMYTIGNDLYLVVARPVETDENGLITRTETFLEKMSLETTSPTDVLLDRQVSAVGVPNAGDTLFSLPYPPTPGAEITLWYANQEIDGQVEHFEDTYWFRAFDMQLTGVEAIMGEKYLMDVGLSTQIMRDERNNFLDGRVTLKDVNIRHYNSGPYSLYLYRNESDPRIVSFDPRHGANPLRSSSGSYSYYETEGNFSPKIQGVPADTAIHIKSDSPVPVNITNIEFRVLFAPAASGSTTQ